ncbi:phosphotransferase [Candidatus Uhrbacteria bacterium]|nr:phosphotransferase [Candidatus Uhrbacteria bacterium]
MEPALPPLHPKLPKLLSALNLEPLDAIKWNVISCRREGKGGPERLVLKFGSNDRKAASIAYEAKLFRGILPGINQVEFERLVIPGYVDDGVFEDIQWILTGYLDGIPLAHRWSELSIKPEILGGLGIDPKIAGYAVDVLRDLRSVDVESMPDYVRRFRFEDWRKVFSDRSRELADLRMIQGVTAEKAGSILNSLPSYRYDGNMFTNGDFYPRNFIVLPGDRIGVTDWVGGIDPWTFVAMHAWLMMWGNPEWQADYIRALVEHFPIDIEEMQAGLLVKSFDAAYRWRIEPEETVGLARSQMLAYFRRFLEIDRVREMFSV